MTIYFQIPPGVIELSKFKFFLGHILGSYKEPEEGKQVQSGPLLLYQQDMRNLVGHTLCPSDCTLDPPGPYIPLCFQNSPTINAGKHAEVSSSIDCL